MSARAWTLTIPAPATWINMNDRRDRRGDTRTAAWRNAARQYARAARLPRLGRAYILVELRFTTGHRRDPHNYYPTIKAVVDGLVDYGLLPDDSARYLLGPDVRLGEPIRRKPYGPVGEMVLTIREQA